jgi:ribosome biogenesis protein BRX1
MKEEKTLMEIGPRFVMNVISVFAGSFGGELLYKNPNYVTPNQVYFDYSDYLCAF